jgi:hypothetical protein
VPPTRRFPLGAMTLLTTWLAAAACHSTQVARPTQAQPPLAAIERPVCALTDATGAGTRWPLGQLAVPDSLLSRTDTARTIAVRLPTAFQPTATRHPDRRRWASPDSTAIELWLSDAPVSSVGGSHVSQFGGEDACTLTLGGHAPAIVVRYWMILSGHEDTLYNAATAALVGPNQAVDAVISSPTRSARDSLLTALAGLELPAVASPRRTPPGR